ncbi:MAG: hypothetical protein ABL952_11255 [Pyrinomonadaceae bacterium]
MKISIILLTLVLSLTAFGTSAGTAADLTGKWSLAADAGGQVVYVSVELKQTGETFTGTTTSDLGAGTIEGGKVAGKNFTATLKTSVQGSAVDFAMSGTFEGDSMSGSLSNSNFGTVPFNATRDK